jgi:hypothetical protein
MMGSHLSVNGHTEKEHVTCLCSCNGSIGLTVPSLNADYRGLLSKAATADSDNATMNRQAVTESVRRVIPGTVGSEVLIPNYMRRGFRLLALSDVSFIWSDKCSMRCIGESTAQKKQPSS